MAVRMRDHTGLTPRLVTGVVAIGVAIVAAWLVQEWRTGATPFRETMGPSYGAELHVGEQIKVGEGGLPLPPVEITSAEVAVRPGSAEAAVNAALCHRARGAMFLGSTGDTPLARYCDELVPIEGADLRGRDDGEWYFVVTILPLEPGQVAIDGIDINFRESMWRTGSQRVDPGVEIDVLP